MAFIVLFSSLSFTMNQHVCGGEIANTTFFIDADNCGMDMNVCKNDTSKQQTSVDKEPCCKDISTLIQGNDNNQQAQHLSLQIPQLEFATAFVYTYVLRFKEISSISLYAMYKPPLVYKNIQTLFQVFRI